MKQYSERAIDRIFELDSVNVDHKQEILRRLANEFCLINSVNLESIDPFSIWISIAIDEEEEREPLEILAEARGIPFEIESDECFLPLSCACEFMLTDLVSDARANGLKGESFYDFFAGLAEGQNLTILQNEVCERRARFLRLNELLKVATLDRFKSEFDFVQAAFAETRLNYLAKQGISFENFRWTFDDLTRLGQALQEPIFEEAEKKGEIWKLEALIDAILASSKIQRRSKVIDLNASIRSLCSEKRDPEEMLKQWRKEQEEALKEILSNPEEKKQLLEFIKDEISFDGILPDDF